MVFRAEGLKDLVEQACGLEPIRVAVVDAAQGLVIETIREAHALGIVEPRLIGVPEAIDDACRSVGFEPRDEWIVPARSDPEAAAKAVHLVRTGAADAVMKGNIHTDAFMRALLDKRTGLRVPDRRVSHVFVTEVPNHPKLLGITDAAINIAPDLGAKAQILQNAVDLYHLLGVAKPKVAVLSAVETVNPEIASTLDAACLALMARRGQITGALVDGPLAFDNAISRTAAEEKGIDSEVAGDADIVLVPGLDSGNILAKNLGYLAGAVAAGLVTGLARPVVLSSRADPPVGRLSALAIASLMHHRASTAISETAEWREPSFLCAPQSEDSCCPMSAGAIAR